MEQFEDGGLKDEGGAVDEVSGNEVPVGGTKKGVRDNIPAMVSEGEFIFPEDVTRYIGLDKLMQLRQDAKMGLKKMEAMGQMGNGDEATMEDDMPFEMADLIIVGGPMEEPQEKYKGGVLHAQQGTYVGQQQQPATGIAGYQPSVYANRAPINPYQYQAPASAFTPPTYQNTQVAPSQPTSGYGPTFVGQGVTRETFTGRETPRVTAEEFVEDIYLEVKYINPETGDIRTFKFYEGEPISTIPAGYVPYEEGQDPAEGTTPPEAEVTVPTTQVSRSDRDDDPTPPPPPFNWDEATPEAIVNEVNKIQGPAGSVITGLAFALNPVLGGLAYAATKANEKQTLTKLGEMLKDKDFVKKMSDAGQLKKLRDSLTGLEEKTKGEGTVDVDLLGILGSAVKGVAKALGLTPEEEKEVIKNSVSDAAGIKPPKKPEQEVEEPTITILDKTSVQEGIDYVQSGYEEAAFGDTGVLGETSVISPDTTKTALTAEEIARIVAGTVEGSDTAETTSTIIQNVVDAAKSGVTTEAPIDPIIAAARRSAEQGAAAFRALQDQPPEEQDTADPLSMAQAAMKAMTREREEQREAAFEPEFLEGLGGAPLGFEAGQVDPALAAAVSGQTQTPAVTTPTVTTPAPTVTTAPRREPRDDDYSASDMMRDMQSRQTQAASVAASEGVSAPTSGGARSVSTPTGNVETYASKVERGGGFNKGGLAGKPKKKASSKKRGLAARK